MDRDRSRSRDRARGGLSELNGEFSQTVEDKWELLFAGKGPGKERIKKTITQRFDRAKAEKWIRQSKHEVHCCNNMSFSIMEVNGGAETGFKHQLEELLSRETDAKSTTTTESIVEVEIDIPDGEERWTYHKVLQCEGIHLSLETILNLDDPLKLPDVLRYTIFARAPALVMNDERILISAVYGAQERRALLSSPVWRKGYPSPRCSDVASLHQVSLVNGESRELKHGDEVRIKALETPGDAAYNCLYGAQSGAAYYDKESDNEKQIWIIKFSGIFDPDRRSSIAKGSHVVFESKNWRGSYLGLYKWDAEGDGWLQCGNGAQTKTWQLL